MPKYWGKPIFCLGRREKERPKVGNNNGQLRIATPPRVAHAKPPGPIEQPEAETDTQWFLMYKQF